MLHDRLSEKKTFSASNGAEIMRFHPWRAGNGGGDNLAMWRQGIHQRLDMRLSMGKGAKVGFVSIPTDAASRIKVWWTKTSCILPRPERMDPSTHSGTLGWGKGYLGLGARLLSNHAGQLSAVKLLRPALFRIRLNNPIENPAYGKLVSFAAVPGCICLHVPTLQRRILRR